jgi:DNA-binding response OmpR family regulator
MKQQLIAQYPAHRRIPHSSEPGIESGQAAAADGDEAIRFRRFKVLPRRRQLLADGRPVELGSRAYDLLMALIKAGGTLVTKEQIVNRVWPSTMVEESNLRVQIATLRKALGKDRDIIKTVTGRGYVFAVEATTEAPEPRALALPGLPSAASPRAPAFPVSMPAGGEGPPTVVVIDDDVGMREALEALLRSVGLQVELFASVQEFLDSERSTRPSCLVLDVRLPGRSGLDFHDDLIQADVHLPVVFISGYADVPMSVRAMKAGAVEFLTKPVRHQDLLDAIQLSIERVAPV